MKNLIFYSLILFFALGSCKEKPTEIHDHEGEEVKIYLTEYSDQFELFAEADPFIVNKSSNILAHFTRLSDFKPLSEGTITASLIVGTKGIRQTINEPLKAGIYGFTLQPETAGIGKIIFDIRTPEENFQIVIQNIEVYTDEHSAIHEAEEAIKSGVNTINFTKEQSWKIDFETIKPLYKPFGEIIKTTAQIIPAQNDEEIITSKINGFIQFSSDISDGLSVSSGKTIATVQGNNLSENNSSVQFSEAQNNYELQKTNYERSQKLAVDQIISEKELLQSKTDYENAKTIFENLKRNFNSQGQIVASDVNGFIKKVFVTNGQFVEPGQALFSIIRNKNLLLRADVSQKYFDALKTIETATFQLPGNKKVYTLEECNGKLVSYGKSIDITDSYQIPVTFRIENKDEFLAGSFVDIYIKTGSDKKSIIVPNSSFIEELGNFFVFVQVSPEMFEKRQVKLGLTDGLYTEIIQGIDTSERIVSKGAVIIKLAAVSNSLDPHAGHVH